MKNKFFFSVCTLLLFVSCKNQFSVSSLEEFDKAKSKLKPGSTLIIKNGEYNNQLFILDVNGTKEQPITIIAETPGKVIFSGNSRLRIGGDYLIIDGLYFKNGSLGALDGGVIEFRRQLTDTEEFISANNSILRNTAIEYYNNKDRKIDYKWISLYGTHNIVEYCELIGKNHSGTAFAVWRDDASPQYHTIRYNKFMYIEDDEDGNGAEALRIGTSQESLSDSFTTVEYNYFEQCNGEIEVISNKSGSNTYKGNTFVNNAGLLTLRHGNNCTVDGNFFFGNDYYGTGGIRIIGENHKITNNYIQNTVGDGGKFRSAISITNGVENGPLNSYAQVKNLYVYNNILINNKKNFIIGAGASDTLSLPPLNVTIENNLVLTEPQDTNIITKYAEPLNIKYINNYMFGSNIGHEFSIDEVNNKKVGYELKNNITYPKNLKGIEVIGEPIRSDETGVKWNDSNFIKRNLFEETYQKIVTLPWSELTKWSGEKGIIVAGIDSADVYIDSTRYKFNMKDSKVTPIFTDNIVKLPKDFFEFHLGSAGKTKFDYYLTLDEIKSIYQREVMYNPKGFIMIIKDPETMQLLSNKRMIDKIADLYKVISSSDDGNIPGNTLDGNLNTRWSADGDGEWLIFNLYENKTFNSMEASFYKGDERVTYFEIQTSLDKKNWVTIFKGESSGKSNKMESFNFPTVSGNFVKLIGHSNSINTWNSINEVQFYDENNNPIMDYVKSKADIFVEKKIEKVVEINLEGKPIPPTDDAYIEIQSPDTVFGKDSDKLRVKAKLDSSIVRISYLKFDITEINDINSAIFQISGKVSTTNPPNPEFTFDVYGLENDQWDEETITWNNSTNHKLESTEVTGLGETLFHLGTFTMSGPGLIKKHIVDITNYVKKQKNIDGIVSLMLVDSRIQNGNTDPYSKERSNESERPYIFIK